MKKIFYLALLIAMATASFSQQPATKTALTREEYLQKSKNQKTTAWILLGGGAALSTGAMIWAVQDLFSPDQGQGALFIAGVSAMAGSIPLFIAAARNKRKAAEMPVTITTKLENARTFQNRQLHTTFYPAITVRLGFK
jgi:hypothetical protein